MCGVARYNSRCAPLNVEYGLASTLMLHVSCWKIFIFVSNLAVDQCRGAHGSGRSGLRHDFGILKPSLTRAVNVRPKPSHLIIRPSQGNWAYYKVYGVYSFGQIITNWKHSLFGLGFRLYITQPKLAQILNGPILYI